MKTLGSSSSSVNWGGGRLFLPMMGEGGRWPLGRLGEWRLSKPNLRLVGEVDAGKGDLKG